MEHPAENDTITLAVVIGLHSNTAVLTVAILQSKAAQAKWGEDECYSISK